MKSKKTRIALMILALLVFGAAGWFAYDYWQQRQQPDPDLIATVGNREIRVKQFKEEAARRGGLRPEGLDRRKLLEELIDYEAMLVKAFEAGLDKDPEVIRAYHNLLVGKLRTRQLEPRIENVAISDEEIKAQYETHIDRYTRPARSRIAILYFETHPTMSPEKRESIRARLAEAREKAQSLSQDERGFGALAIRYSEDQASRYKGGDIGWLAQGRAYRWPDPVVSAGFSLETIGDVSDVIETDNGLYLVKLLDRRDAVATPLEKAKTRIRHKMLLEKRKQTEAAFIAEQRAATEITIYPDVLASIPMPETGKPGLAPPSLP